MNTIQEVNTSIMQGNFTNEQVDSIIDAVKFRRSILSRQNKREFNVGSKVKFTSTRSGLVMSGSVSKIAIKFVTVQTTSGNWKVPANMLTAA